MLSVLLDVIVRNLWVKLVLLLSYIGVIHSHCLILSIDCYLPKHINVMSLFFHIVDLYL